MAENIKSLYFKLNSCFLALMLAENTSFYVTKKEFKKDIKY